MKIPHKPQKIERGLWTCFIAMMLIIMIAHCCSCTPVLTQSHPGDCDVLNVIGDSVIVRYNNDTVIWSNKYLNLPQGARGWLLVKDEFRGVDCW